MARDFTKRRADSSYALIIFFLGLFVGSEALRRHEPSELSVGVGLSTPLRSEAYVDQRQTSVRRESTVNVPAASSPEDHLVTEPLPLMKDGEQLSIKHWAGHLPVSTDKQKYFFYWLFEPETVDDNTPLLIWLNGGPGCSSMDGLFLENGPIQWTMVDGNYMLQQNPHSWHTAPAYTLYIDQPVGTGLSFTTNGHYPTNDLEVNIDFYFFLKSFFNLHADKFVENNSVWRKVFFSGESHAGHYIPHMMNFILQKNKHRGKPTIPLAGAAIGNGWMDPVYQYAAAEAAYGHGLLGRSQVNALDAEEQKCQELLRKGNYRSSICFDLLDDIVKQGYGLHSQYKMSPYDNRISEKKNAPKTFPKNHKVVECYLGGRNLPSWVNGTMGCEVKDSVLEIIHATAATMAKQTFQECTDPPYSALAHQDGKGVVDDIVAVLEDPSKPRLLFFNGIEDLICNHVGNEKALVNLPWNKKDQWVAADRYAWYAEREDRPVGFMKEFENLQFLKLLNAGHMVPMDLPDISLDMIKVFLAGASFADKSQGLHRSSSAPPASCPICATCPAEGECPKCPSEEIVPSPSVKNCTGEVAKAKEDLLAKVGESDKGSKPALGPVSFSWAIPLVILLFVLFGIIMLRRRREGRELVSSQGEFSDEQYQDESVDGEGRSGNGVI